MCPGDQETQGQAPSVATNAVLKSSSKYYCQGMNHVHGYTFEDENGKPKLDYKQLLRSYSATGLQATHFGRAIDIVNEMLAERDKPFEPDLTIEDDMVRPRKACTIFLSYTSNMISSGMRENIKFLVKNKLVDCIVTTAGGIEEDLIKCLRTESDQQADTFVGDFKLPGSDLRENGINRIGNLLVPNRNYCSFQDWIIPILDKMVIEQSENKTVWTPSKIIERLGLEINNEDSVCYWAAKNKIPIFCPALTDGSLGDMIYLHSFKSDGLDVNISVDARRILSLAYNTENYKTGAIILGGGVSKHHIMNANLFRDGADFAVYINTAPEFDGSDSGAEPEEAISWGKLKSGAKKVKVVCEASLVFPLLIAETFYEYLTKQKP